MVTGRTSIEDLEKKIAAIEDRNAIQELTAKYCFTNNERNIPAIMDLFHEKAELGTPWGHYKYKEEVAKFFAAIFNVATDMHHLTHNHIITVNGEEGSCVCHFEAEYTAGGKPIICAGTYDDKLVKENGTWVFMSRIIKLDYVVPLNEGWAGERKIQLSI
jgi:hypothetical protein